MEDAVLVAGMAASLVAGFSALFSP